jgi:hypothetical protein
MLICLNGIYFEAEPVPAPEGEITPILKENRVILQKGGKTIEYGAKFFKLRGFGAICSETGAITGPKSKYRAVFNNQHYDFEV